jgi:hypothetical protein
MYKLYKFNGEVVSIKRLSDGSSIPLVEGNCDYREYLAWVAAGNTPEPADE